MEMITSKQREALARVATELEGNSQLRVFEKLLQQMPSFDVTVLIGKNHDTLEDDDEEIGDDIRGAFFSPEEAMAYMTRQISPGYSDCQGRYDVGLLSIGGKSKSRLPRKIMLEGTDERGFLATQEVRRTIYEDLVKSLRK